jgi:hypothetical protein
MKRIYVFDKYEKYRKFGHRRAAVREWFTELESPSCILTLPINMIGLMDERCGRRAIVPFRLTAEVAQRRIRELAADSANIRWSRHIRERMVERGFDSEDCLRILRTGFVEADPVKGEAEGEWKVKVIREMTNRRVAGVVTLLPGEGAMKLLTVEWEDRR